MKIATDSQCAGARWLLGVLTACFILLPGLQAYGAYSPPPVDSPTILFLNSYDQMLDWAQKQLQGIQDELEPCNHHVDLHVEYMDTKWYSSPEYYKLYTDVLRYKYARNKPDLILVSDNNAFDFLQKIKTELFPGVPVVFGGLNSYDPKMIEDCPECTGVAERLSIGDTVSLLRELHPEATSLFVINDQLPTGRMIAGEVENQIGNGQIPLRIEHSKAGSVEELKRRIDSLEPGTIVLLGAYFADNQGATFSAREVCPALFSDCSVPVYCLVRQNVHNGVIGGKVLDGYEHGQAMASIADKILHGTLPKDIPVIEDGANSYVFDYDQLERWDIAEANLPTSSTVLNRTYSLYHRHTIFFWLGIGVLVYLIATVILLSFSVSRRKRAEQKLRASKDMLRALFDQTFQFSALLDLEGRVIDVNRTALTFGGVELKDIKGVPFWETPWWRNSRESREIIRSAVDKVKEGQIIRFESSNTGGDGSQLEMDASIKPVRNEQGEIISMLCEGRDISLHKQAEIKVHSMRNLLRSIIDSMPSTLIAVDEDGNVTQWNRHAELVTGFAADQAQGRNLAEVYPRLHREMGHIQEVMQSGEPLVRKKIPAPNGNIVRYEDITLFPLTADGARGVVIRLEDVTEQAHIEAVMIQTEKMVSVGGLAAGMAHEINNPLGVILQGAQNIERRLSPSIAANKKAAEELSVTLEAVYDYLEKRSVFKMIRGITEAAQRAADIVRTMLEFSRKSESRLAPCYLPELMDTALELVAQDYELRKQYGFNQIEFVREYETSIPEIPCTCTEMEQVFLNLIKNAAQAIADPALENRPKYPKITLRIAQEDEWVVAEVEDNGPGLDEETAKRVFEPFFTTKPTGTGTGLGLSVSFFIVNQNHLGDFSVESQPGQGARFIVRLPLTR